MKYRVKSDKLDDLLTKTIRLTASASSLGSVAANVLSIPLADISSDAIAATDVIISNNVTAATALTPAISGTNLTLSAASVLGTHVVDLVIRLK